MSSRALILVLLLALAVPAFAAGPHLAPGTIVADGGADQGAIVLLYVQGGYGDAQSVYVIRAVARCRDPAGPGWYALRAGRELRSAPELEMRQRLGTLDPDALPVSCSDPLPAHLPPARTTGWDRLVNGTLAPFGPIAFPSFVPS